jgi:hypothetical protein
VTTALSRSRQRAKLKPAGRGGPRAAAPPSSRLNTSFMVFDEGLTAGGAALVPHRCDKCYEVVRI